MSDSKCPIPMQSVRKSLSLVGGKALVHGAAVSVKRNHSIRFYSTECNAGFAWSNLQHLDIFHLGISLDTATREQNLLYEGGESDEEANEWAPCEQNNRIRKKKLPQVGFEPLEMDESHPPQRESNGPSEGWTMRRRRDASLPTDSNPTSGIYL